MAHQTEMGWRRTYWLSTRRARILGARLAPVLCACLLGSTACSDDDSDVPAGEGGAENGGASTNGGTSSGGTTNRGGSANGGAPGAGSAGKATGGTATGGTATGGVTSGGSSGASGGPGTGGTVAGGGTVAAGAGGAVAAGAGGTSTGGIALTAGAGGDSAGAGGIATTGGTASEAGSAGTTVVTTGGTAGAPTGGTTGVAGSTGEGGSAGTAGDVGTAGAAGTPGTIFTITDPPVAILQYDLDETTGTIADDKTANNNDGTLTDVTWSSTTMRNVGAANFAGINSRIAIPGGKLANVHGMTVAAWVNLSGAVDSTVPVDTTLFSFGSETTYLKLYLNYTGGLSLRFKGSSGIEKGVTTLTQLPLPRTYATGTVWKHLAVTMSANGGAAIYVDGKIVAYNAGLAIDPADLGTTTEDYIGNSATATTQLFQGTVDEFYVYDGILPLADIRTLAAPKNDYVMYHFDEGTGTTAADASLGHKDGTLVGATWVPGIIGTAVKMTNSTTAPATQYVDLTSGVLANCTATAANSTFAGWINIEEHRTDAPAFEFSPPAPNTNNNYINLMTTMGGSTTNPVIAFGAVMNTSGRTVRTQNYAWTLNTWYHVAIVRSESALGTGRLVTVYRNGEQAAQSSLTGSGFGTSGTFGGFTVGAFGKDFRNTIAGFDGAVDEWLFACRAYTLDEVKQLAYQPPQ